VMEVTYRGETPSSEQIVQQRETATVFARRDAPPSCCVPVRPAPPFALAAVWLLHARKLTPHPAATSETATSENATSENATSETAGKQVSQYRSSLGTGVAYREMTPPFIAPDKP
jgi:hypothetical protein